MTLTMNALNAGARLTGAMFLVNRGACNVTGAYKMTDQIGCDKNGKCIAKSMVECWRFSGWWLDQNVCEYNKNGVCQNVHAIEEMKESEEQERKERIEEDRAALDDEKAERIAREEGDRHRRDAALQNIRNEIILSLSEIEKAHDIDFCMESIADAIISGKIKHVKYTW